MIAHTPISRLPVLVAPHRESRPHGYDGVPCPFCPGAEDQTPPEILRDGDPWRIRLVPNKYPASQPHEVMIESAEHDRNFDELSFAHAARVVELSFQRYQTLRATSPFVTLFKNQGPLAGASLPHPHSQILGTSVAPARVALESRAFGEQVRCPLCAESPHSLIAESDHYRWIAPAGSTMAWQQWIVPLRHQAEMSDPGDLARLLQAAVGATRTISVSFNWAFLNFPNEPRAHWYLELFPRLTPVAGFELGLGTFINTVDPADAARVLRASMGTSR